jgi:periplasmic protein TonB
LTSTRATAITGNIRINLVVGTNGIPSDLNIVRPVGAGLDEKALEAVQQYRFDPATEGGKPVAVEMNVEVNFQTF